MNAPAGPPPVDTLLRQVLGEAAERRLRLATAESCTGGLIASMLTDVPGCSHAFERGFVTYSDEAKCELLGIAPDFIEQHGAVSAQVAAAMAEGALENSRADIAVAVTGYADNSAPEGKAGEVFVAAARRGRGTQTRRYDFGDLGRDGVRSAAAHAALELFRFQIV